jgi:carboxylate-amine ligase
MGAGADRQLRVFKETGDLTKVVDFMISETETGVVEKDKADANIAT